MARATGPRPRSGTLTTKTKDSKTKDQRPKDKDTMTTDIAIRPVSDFAIFANPDINIAELITDNLEGEEFSPQDLTRISVPGGGGQTFSIPSPGGDIDAKTIEGIIIKVQTVRIYFSQPFGSGEVTPPDCFSNDGMTGIGNPGGNCATCPLNEWGSKGDGKKGKVCSEKRNIFILPADSLLPYVLSAPVMSIKNYKTYLQHLTRKGISIKAVTTIVGLEKDKNEGGIAYSKLTFREGTKIEGEHLAVINGYRAAFAGVVDSACHTPPANGGGNPFE